MPDARHGSDLAAPDAHTPINPASVHGAATKDLPAYLSNGVFGLRVRANACSAGMMRVCGFAGEDPLRLIEVGAPAPYPLALDLAIDGVWMSDTLSEVSDLVQSYDFATGELTSRLSFGTESGRANIEVITFCSREQPTIVCQETSLSFDRDCEVTLRATVDGRGVDGRPVRALRRIPGETSELKDGAMLWESSGGYASCGIAYATQLIGAEVEPTRPGLEDQRLLSKYAFRAGAARTYRLRQIASIVPSVTHHQPDCEAARLLGKVTKEGFDRLRDANRRCWSRLWRSRIRIIGAEERWQGLADAAFYYLNSSVHASSPASTSMFGLATWHDYHYYYGHVMWDIEAFCLPAVTLLQPDAAAALLDFRTRTLSAAQRNARLFGRRGLQFPWESAPSTGEEGAPLPGSASWHEDHASLDVAEAFAVYANLTGDKSFLREKAWPVLCGVSEWIVSRVVESERGYEFPAAMGIAEREEPSDNSAFTNMAAIKILRQAADVGRRLGCDVDPAWEKIAAGLVLPKQGDVIVSHDGYDPKEDKGATPDPLMGLFPLGFALDEAVERATLDYYLDMAEDYVGAPMLSALYGVWAARLGDRERSLQLLEDGYGKFMIGRFDQTLEYRRDKFPEQPSAGPFFANIGGFLISLILGFSGLEPSSDDISTWPRRPVVLPAGWQAIEIDRLWVRGRPVRLRAEHGAERAMLEFRDVA